MADPAETPALRSAGFYHARVRKWSVEAPPDKPPRLWMSFELLGYGGSEGEDYEQVEGGRASVYLSLSLNALSYTLDKLAALGYDRSSIRDANPESPEAFDFFGREGVLQLKHDEYQSKVREKWDVTRRRPPVASPAGEEWDEIVAALEGSAA